MCIVQVSCLCKSSTKKLLCAFVITYLLRIVKKEWFVVCVTYVDYVTLTNDAYQYSTCMAFLLFVRKRMDTMQRVI